LSSKKSGRITKSLLWDLRGAGNAGDVNQKRPAQSREVGDLFIDGKMKGSKKEIRGS